MLLVLLVSSIALAAPAGSAGNHHSLARQSSEECGADGCRLLVAAPTEPTSLSAADLTAALDEERAAGDLYRLAAARWQLAVFSHIAAAEARHARVFETLAASAGVHVVPAQPGVYQTAEARKLYAEMIPLMEGSWEGALKAAALLETTNLSDLRALAARASDEPTKRVLMQLERASTRHLRAFERNLRRLGEQGEPNPAAAEEACGRRRVDRSDTRPCGGAVAR